MERKGKGKEDFPFLFAHNKRLQFTEELLMLFEAVFTYPHFSKGAGIFCIPQDRLQATNKSLLLRAFS
jgi:hypothetical protein